MGKVRVGLFFGGRSNEHPVSIMSAASIFPAIDRYRFNVIPIAISREGIWMDPESSRLTLRNGVFQTGEAVTLFRGEQGAQLILSQSHRVLPLDVAFPVLHGPYGEDGTIQGFFQLLDLPCVGAGVLASALTMDKGYMKKILGLADLPQTQYRVMERENWCEKKREIAKEVQETIGMPCFVKPAAQGSSLGIEKVNEISALIPAIEKAFAFGPRVLLEAYVSGRELECSVLGNTKPRVAGPGEVVYESEFYDYQAKYTEGGAELLIPAPVPLKVKKELQMLSLKAFKALDCRGMARVDFFYQEDGTILINEVNTIPGFTPYSMYPKLWQAQGMTYSDLLNTLLELALET